MYASGISFTGVASLSSSSSAINGANNGLSTSTISPDLVVLGQDIGAVGSPADLLDDRELNMKAFYWNLFGGRIVLSDTASPGDGSTPLEINSAAPLLQSWQGTGNVALFKNGGMLWSGPVNGQFFSVEEIGVQTGPLGFQYLCQADASLAPSTGNLKARVFGVIGDWSPTGGSNAYTGYTVETAIFAAGAGEIHGFHVDWVIGSLGTGRLIGFENNSGDNYFNSGATNTGRTGFQKVRSPLAWVHIGAGLAAANSAPFKFTGSGSAALLTTPEIGAMEYTNAAGLFFTPGTSARHNILLGDAGVSPPPVTAGVAFTGFYGTSSTNVLGEPDEWGTIIYGNSAFRVPLYV